MTADECVREMRETVHRETKLTVSAGIAPNRVRPLLCTFREHTRSFISDAGKGAQF